jgi:hypothetical protein
MYQHSARNVTRSAIATPLARSRYINPRHIILLPASSLPPWTSKKESQVCVCLQLNVSPPLLQSPNHSKLNKFTTNGPCRARPTTWRFSKKRHVRTIGSKIKNKINKINKTQLPCCEDWLGCYFLCWTWWANAIECVLCATRILSLSLRTGRARNDTLATYRAAAAAHSRHCCISPPFFPSTLKDNQKRNGDSKTLNSRRSIGMATVTVKIERERGTREDSADRFERTAIECRVMRA